MFRALMQTAARVRAFVRCDDLDREFADELDAHLAMQTDDNVRRGMTPEEARRAAVIHIGAPVSLKEQHRAARGLPGLEGIAQDVRFAGRLIARDRWFSAAIAAALALGIGANTIGFTIVNATLFGEIPGGHGARLYTMSWRNRSGGQARLIRERAVIADIGRAVGLRRDAGKAAASSAPLLQLRRRDIHPAVAIAACLVPVRRATRIDPVAALRAD